MALLVASLTLIGTLLSGQPQADPRMGQVSGQVIEDGTNVPVAGARVFLVIDGVFSPGAALPPSSITDRDGRFRFEALAPGRYRIAAQKASFVPPMAPSAMTAFELSAGQILDGLNVSLRKGGVLAGRVLDPFGQPLVEVSVTALLKRLDSREPPSQVALAGAPMLMPSGQNQTNDLGDFRIFGLAPGEYVVMASPRSEMGGTASSLGTSTYFPGTADLSEARPLTVRAGETVSALTIQLVAVPGFQVSGVVIDEAGAQLAGVMVMLMTAAQPGADSLRFLAMGPPGMTQSGANGRFVFSDLPAGSYTLRAGEGGIGAFADVHDEFFTIDRDGTPRTDPSRQQPVRPPGTIEVTIESSNVTGLKIVVPRSR